MKKYALVCLRFVWFRVEVVRCFMPELLEIAVARAMEYFDKFKFHIGFLLILLIILELRLPEVFRR